MLSTVRISTLQPSTVFCFICNGVEQSCKSQSEAAPICYRSPTMLREGNVFSHVCLSDCPQGGTYVTTHGSVQTCSLEDTPPPKKKLPSSALPVQTCSWRSGAIFRYSLRDISVPSLSPRPDLFKLVHYVAHTSIGKQAVGLPIKGLLVTMCKCSLSVKTP